MATKLEKQYIEAVVKDAKIVTARAAELDLGSKPFYVSTHKEACRLLDSADYKAGWQACWDRFANSLSLITVDDRKLMKRIVRSAKLETEAREGK